MLGVVAAQLANLTLLDLKRLTENRRGNRLFSCSAAFLCVSMRLAGCERRNRQTGGKGEGKGCYQCRLRAFLLRPVPLASVQAILSGVA